MVRRSSRTRRNRSKKRRSARKQKGGSEMYVAASLEFELPGRFPLILSENHIEDIKMKIGQYFADNKVPFTYYGTENQYHIFTTLRSRSAYFNLSGGSIEQEPTAGVFVDFEISLDSVVGPQLTTQEINDLKTKIRYTVKDSAQYLIYKGLFSNMHVFVTDYNVIHGRQL